MAGLSFLNQAVIRSSAPSIAGRKKSRGRNARGWVSDNWDVGYLGRSSSTRPLPRFLPLQSPLGAAAEHVGGPTRNPSVFCQNPSGVQFQNEPLNELALSERNSRRDPAMANVPRKLKDDTPRRLGEFLDVPNDERMNPQSIRRMIFEYIVRCHGRDCEVAAEQLELHRVKHKGRRYKSGITKNSLYKLTRDEHPIKYFLLEAIAIERRVPVSLLLFYTRLNADQAEPDGQAKVNILLDGLASAVEDARAKIKRAKPINFEDLAQWIDKFVELSPQVTALENLEGLAAPDAVDTDRDEPTLPGLDLPLQSKPSASMPGDGGS
jgi:hypothetical protein